jgi:hypothetical protein
MASWKRFFNTPNPNLSSKAFVPSNNDTQYSNFSSGLKEFYTGPSNRLERYNQLDQLDRDPVVSAALNILAEFCTQENEFSKLPFYIHYADQSNENETMILKETLTKWSYINEFRKRMFFIMRNLLKYGDCFFLRDPETFEWHYIDPRNIEKIVVDDENGKKIFSYFVRNMSLNLSQKIATHDVKNVQRNTNLNMGFAAASANSRVVTNNTQNAGVGTSLEISANHIIHLSLNSTGLDYMTWPFSASYLDSIYKAAKQKELLENAYLIYKVQRAPEKRVFYIYTGDLPSHKAMAYIERFKNELHQKRIPSRQGGTGSIVDSTYDPQCLDMNTRIPLLDGRTLSIYELTEEYEQGKQNWAYSTDIKTGKILPGPITWAGMTRKDAQVLKLTLDNGEELILTPDHKIPVWGKGYVEAKDIIVDKDSIISFKINEKVVANNRTYTTVYDHSNKKYTLVHRLVAEFMQEHDRHNQYTFDTSFKDELKTTVHHYDYNRYNNNPDNLYWMSFNDHRALHTSKIMNFWNIASEKQKNEVKDKISQSLKTYFKSDEYLLNEDKVQKAKKHAYDVLVTSITLEERLENLKIAHEILKEKRKDPNHLEKWKKNLSKSLKGHKSNQEMIFTENLLEILKKITIEHSFDYYPVIDALDSSDEFKNELRLSNPKIEGKGCRFNFDQIQGKRLRKMLKSFGFKSWKEFCYSIGKPRPTYMIKKSSRTQENCNQPTKFSHEQLNFIYMAAKEVNFDINKTVDRLNEISEYHEVFERDNQVDPMYNISFIRLDKANVGRIYKTIRAFGFKNWMDFKRKKNEFNHKVIKIEWLEEKIDTGCITIDGNNEYHGHHNFAVEQGIFVKNSLLEDYYMSVNSEGQGPRVETLPGGEGLSSGVDDMLYFNNHIIRGLGIPTSYLPTGAEDSGQTYNDGKTGVAFISEWRFAKSCMRIQGMVRDTFDYEFKLFCKQKGITINASDFNLEFEEPQSFGEYRRMEKDQTMLGVLQQIDGIKHISKRFALKRFGGFTEEEITENEAMWKQENRGKVKDKVADLEINDFQELSLNSVGVKKEIADEDQYGQEEDDEIS